MGGSQSVASGGQAAGTGAAASAGASTSDVLESTDWSSYDNLSKINIDKAGSGNDTLIITLSERQAIVGNYDYLVYTNSNIKLLSDNVTFEKGNGSAAAAAAPALAAVGAANVATFPPIPEEAEAEAPEEEAAPSEEEEYHAEPPPSDEEEDHSDALSDEEEEHAEPPQPQPPIEEEPALANAQPAAASPQQKLAPTAVIPPPVLGTGQFAAPANTKPAVTTGGAAATGALAVIQIPMVTFYAARDNAKVCLCPSIGSEITQIDIGSGDSWNVIHSGILAYTKELTVSNIGEWNALYEIDKRAAGAGILFTKITNTSDMHQLMWLTGYGAIEHIILTEGEDMSVNVTRLLAHKCATYKIERKNNIVFIGLTGPCEFYIHSKDGAQYGSVVSAYINSKQQLLDSIPANFNAEVGAVAPSLPLSGGRRGGASRQGADYGKRRPFKNEMAQSQDVGKHFDDLMKKFIR